MEESAYLSKFASKVTIIHRRDQLRASSIMQKRTLDLPNVEMAWNKTVSEVIGDEKIEAVMLKDTLTDAEERLDVKGLFIAIGHTPATGFLSGSGVELDDAGYVKLPNRSSETNIAGVFAGGDVADSEYRQAVTAAGMGCQAAMDAERWLGTQGLA